MNDVFLGLGSNIERERYLVAGLDALQRLLGEFRYSSVYDSAAIGFDGQPFLNMVIATRTDLPLAELARQLRHIEFEHGRPENASRFSARQLDIDILLYGDLSGVVEGVELPRGEILYNAFVLQPLAELAPQRLHPVLQRSYGELWEAFGKTPEQALRRVDFDWRGQTISIADT